MRLRYALLSVALLCSCAQKGTYALVTFSGIGTVPANVASIGLTLTLGTQTASTTIKSSSGSITLPTTASLQIRNGMGTLQVVATAFDGGGNVLGSGTGSGDVKSGATTPIDVSIAFVGGSTAMLQIDHQPSFDFGAVPLTTQSSPATFNVTNAGNDPTGALQPAALAGSGADAFKIMDDGCMGTTLMPLASCTITVVMAPTTAGMPTATLTVAAAPGGNASTQLTGNALKLGAIAASPSPADFGTVTLPNGGADRTITVTNTGGTGTGGITLSLNGTDANQFSITGGTCVNGQMLAAGVACTVIVHFAPTSSGNKAASLQIDATPGGPGIASLSGKAAAPAALGFSMASYTIPGNVAVGGSGTVTMTLLNHGNQDSGPLPTLALTGDPAFTITGGTCMQGNVVAGGASCSIIVTFQPTSYGPTSAQISVAAMPGGTAQATVVANGQTTFTLTVNKNGSTGGGSITSTPAGDINCDASNTKCSNAYTVAGNAPMVTLHAAADATSLFVGWQGDCLSAGTSDCQLTMDTNHTATAVFKAQYTVSLSFSGAATGAVTIQPGNTVCTAPTSCSVKVTSGTSVSLTAKTNNGSSSVVTGWTGACAANGPARACILTVSSNVSTTVNLATLPANLVFVSSQTYAPNLGSAAAYQTQCNTLATNAGINNTAGNAYVAWMGASNYNPITLAGSSRGWVRADLLPWIDNMTTAISSGIVYYPAAFDENGNRVGSFTWSGLNGNGTVATGYNCADWTDNTTMQTTTGHTHAQGLNWPSSNFGVSMCNISNVRILCVMIGGTTPVSPTAAAGKKTWLTKSTWAPGGGISSANAKCLSDAPAGVASAKAILVSSTQALTDVLGATTNYVRPDGVRVGTGADIISALNNFASPATLEGGIIQDGAGSYIAGKYGTIDGIWTGINYSGTPDKDTCRDWLSSASTDSGTSGSETGWTFYVGKNGNMPCNNMYPQFLRCAEQ